MRVGFGAFGLDRAGRWQAGALHLLARYVTPSELRSYAQEVLPDYIAGYESEKGKLTPDHRRAGYRNSMRALCNTADISVVEGPIARLELLAASEMFVTNSLVEIMPVRRFDGGELSVGPATKRLAEAYAGLTP